MSVFAAAQNFVRAISWRVLCTIGGTERFGISINLLYHFSGNTQLASNGMVDCYRPRFPTQFSRSAQTARLLRDPSNSIPLGREFEIANPVLACSKRVECGNLVGIEGNVENTQILCDAFGIA